MVCGMSIHALTRADAGRRLRARLTGEAGSLLIETMVSAVIVLLVGAGVMNMMDRGSKLSGEQRLLATAANLAQSEQERVRAYSVANLSNLRETRATLPVNGVVYTIASRTDWIDDGLAPGGCTTATGSPDYMKLTTSVTYPTIGNRKPITLQSLVAPPARTFGPTQASLSVRVVNGHVPAEPIAGLTLNLSGTRTLADPTSADGCVLWGFLPATGTYTVAGSAAGHATPDGSATINKTYNNLPGNETTYYNAEYDLAGGLRATFTTKRSAAAAVTSTAPQKAMVDHSDARFTTAKPFNVTGDALDTGLALWGFSSPYSIYAGGCTSAKPAAGANIGSALVVAGTTSSPATVQIPAMNILVQNNGVNVANAVVKVTSCGTTYTRTTDATGLVTDPGFPYGILSVCVSNGARKRQSTVSNSTYPATNTTQDVGTFFSSTGTCP